MKISARNVWLGNVTHIEKGAVNSVVTVALKGRDTIVSVITENSVQRLGLQPGVEVLAIVKAPSVMLALDVDRRKISARNILEGRINRIIPGIVNDEVIIDLDVGNTVTSILTSEGVKRLGLREGMTISAIIKASDVLLAIA
jgi:molybdate transport system regulatory protein